MKIPLFEVISNLNIDLSQILMKMCEMPLNPMARDRDRNRLGGPLHILFFDIV